jgi:uncharacterized membrane protein
VLEFLKDRVWDPIFLREGYNPYSTLAFALLFIAVVEIYWRFFAKGMDQRKFRRAAVPFIVLGGLLRFADSRLVTASAFTVTPGVYFLVLAVFSLLYRFIGADTTWKIGTGASAALLLVELPLLGFSRALLVIPVAVICLAVFRLFGRLDFMKDGFAWKPHVFEAWVTSFGVYAGLMEEHVVAGALMGYSPFLFGLVKTAMLPLIMWLLRGTEKKQKLYVGTVIGMLGLGPGIRDLMELLSLGG